MALTKIDKKLITSTIAAAKTTTVTLGSDEEFVQLSSSGGAYTVTLPAVADMVGRTLVLMKTTSDFNIITIDGNASETINGVATTTLATQYECLHLLGTSGGWVVVRREIPGD